MLLSRFSSLLAGLLCALVLVGCTAPRGLAASGPADDIRGEVAWLVVPYTDGEERGVPYNPPDKLTADERGLLLSVLATENSIREVKFLGVLRALIRDGHPDTVARLCELLHEQENRYYALALGAIGDKSAIPALRRRCRTTMYDFVYNDCRFALHLLGDRSSLERLPTPSRPAHSPLQITVATERAEVGEGETLDVTVTYRNGWDEPIRYFRPIFSHCQLVSADGDHLIKIRGGGSIFYEVTEDYFLELQPGEEAEYIEQYELVRRPRGIERRFFRQFEQQGDVLCLVQPDGFRQGWQLAVYEPGRRLALRLAYIYDGEWTRHDAERLGIEHAVLSRVVSNAVEVTVVAGESSGDDQGR